MDGALLTLSVLFAIWLVQHWCYLVRRLAQRQAVSDAWDGLYDALQLRHDMLDSVRRIVRRRGLESSLGLCAVTEAQQSAREAIRGTSFERIVLAEYHLDARVSALNALINYQDCDAADDAPEDFADLSASLVMANTAVEYAVQCYNAAVDNNNASVRPSAFNWLIAINGPPYAMAFRPAGERADSYEPYTLAA